MDPVIITEYPLWFLIFCVLISAGITLLLYYKNKKYNIPPVLTRVLAVVRFLALCIITFLLLSPLVKTVSRKVEKPFIIVAQDNTESLLYNKDSAFYRKEYKEKLSKFIDDLGEKFEVKTFSFGDSVKEKKTFDFKGKLTDISAFFDELQTRFTKRNIGALVLATDGIFNKGKNPLYASDNISFPVYTMALGDTNVYRDLILSKINYNKTAFLGNKFPVEIVINANKCKGESSTLKVMKGTNVLYSKTLDFTTSSGTHNVLLDLDATPKGLQHYHVELSPVKNEVTTANNSMDFFVDVLDQRQKILILANSPNPDIAAIKESLEKNDNYEVTSALAGDYTGSLKGFNLIILHQLPSTTNNAAFIMSAAESSGTSVIYIVGSQTNLATFNGLKSGLNISSNSQTTMDEVLPLINNDFPLFTISNEVKNMADELPPLFSPFGTYKASTSANILFYQKIGTVATKQPLVLFSQNDQAKTCVIAGEGLWKWKLSDYMQNQNQEAFDWLLGKFVQFLVVVEDKSFFKISGNYNFFENENVEFDAEVYNESYELINEPDVRLTITNKKGKEFPFVFSKTSSAYHLSAGIFPIGEYKYDAHVKAGNNIYTKAGTFNVLPLNVEALSTTADHKTLYDIARKHDGKMFYPSQFDDLLKAINSRNDIKPISFTQKRLNEMMNLFWVFIIILVLFYIEWALRKWSGNY